MEKVRVRRRGECQLHLGTRGEPRDERAVLLLLVLHGEALAPPLAAHLKRRPHARPRVPQAAVADERRAGGGLSGDMARHRVAHAALVGSRPPPVGTDRDEVRAGVEPLLGLGLRSGLGLGLGLGRAWVVEYDDDEREREEKKTAVQAAQIALVMRIHSKCIARARARRFMIMRVRDARTDGHGGAVAH